MPLSTASASDLLLRPCGCIQPMKRPLMLTPEVATASDPSALPISPTRCKRNHDKKTRASRMPLFVPAQHIAPTHSAMQVLRVQDDFCFEPRQHCGVLRHQADPKKHQDAPDRRVVPVLACAVLVVNPRPARTSEQHEVDGHEPARPGVSQVIQTTRPSALQPLWKSSICFQWTRRRVADRDPAIAR